MVLNFRDIGKGDTWNPLSLPYELWKAGNKDEAGFLMSDIAASLAGPLAQNAKDPYWTEAAQEMAVAGFYVLMEAAKKEEVNMKSFANMSSSANIENLKDLAKMMREDSIAGLNYSSTVGLSASSTVAGIVGTLYGMLRVFTANEKLSQMLTETSFDMRMFGREKTAVYLIVPDEKTTYHFLVTMFLKQAYEIMIEEAQKEKNRTLPVRVNFVLDEFCNMPRIPDMATMISAARSRNMRYFLVVQSLHQLKGRYGEDADTIKGNCDNWVFLTSKELDLLNEISELCGSIILPDGQQRRLISASELQRFDKSKGEALIMHCRQYPIISEMADISQYDMFGIYETEQLEIQRDREIDCFSVNELLYAIKQGKAIAPFASDAHMLKQAKAIYKQELNVLGVNDMTSSDIDEYERRRNMAGFLRQLEEEQEKNKQQNKKETQKDKKERKEKIRIAQSRAFSRIAELMGEEYANRFFAENMDSSADDDDDSDW